MHFYMNKKFVFDSTFTELFQFVSKGPVDNKLALVQIMTWRRTGDKPLP